MRPDEKLQFHFSGEMSQRLLQPATGQGQRSVPELPEVETTRRGLTPHLQGQRIRTAIVRNARLRWPVPRKLPALVAGRTHRTAGSAQQVSADRLRRGPG